MSRTANISLLLNTQKYWKMKGQISPKMRGAILCVRIIRQRRCYRKSVAASSAGRLQYLFTGCFQTVSTRNSTKRSAYASLLGVDLINLLSHGIWMHGLLQQAKTITRSGLRVWLCFHLSLLPEVIRKYLFHPFEQLQELFCLFGHSAVQLVGCCFVLFVLLHFSSFWNIAHWSLLER